MSIGTIAALVAGVGSGVLAAPAWATNGPVVPSQSQVDQANAATAAKAVQIGQTEAELAAANASLNRLNDSAESAIEAYDGAEVTVQAAQATVTAAQSAAASASQAFATASRQLQVLASASYRGQGQFAALAALFSAKSPDTYQSQSADLSAVTRQQQGIIDAASKAAQKRDAAEAVAVKALARQSAAGKAAERAKNAALKAMSDQTTQVQKINNNQLELSAQLAVLKGTAKNITEARKAGLAALAAQRAAAAAAAAAAAKRQAELARQAQIAEQAREAQLATQARQAAKDAAAKAARDAAARNAAAAAAAANNSTPGTSSESPTSNISSTGSSTSGTGSSTSGATNVDVVGPGSGTSVSTAGQRSKAIAFAESQIGIWYRWAGDGSVGPTQTSSGIQNVSGYDCSGLTMKAYAAAGISLAHFTGDQWNEGLRVSQSQLVPGDLVFFATNIQDPSTIHHVGIYIGNGQMVDAPETGEQIGIHNAFTPDYIGAVQP